MPPFGAGAVSFTVQLSLSDPVIESLLQENELNTTEVVAALTCAVGLTGDCCAWLSSRAPMPEATLVTMSACAICTCGLAAKQCTGCKKLVPGVASVTELKGRTESGL